MLLNQGVKKNKQISKRSNLELKIMGHLTEIQVAKFEFNSSIQLNAQSSHQRIFNVTKDDYLPLI